MSQLFGVLGITGAGFKPQPHKDYLNKILQNKTIQNLKGYENIGL
jgi:hypothetical protein